MAIFKKKTGGTKVGNALRGVFKAPASYTPPKVTINKPSVPSVKAPNISSGIKSVASALSSTKASASSISPKPAVGSIGGMSIAKPVTTFGTPSIKKSTNTGITSGPNQNMSPAIKTPNMSPAFIGPTYYGSTKSTGGSGGATRTFGAGSTSTVTNNYDNTYDKSQDINTNSTLDMLGTPYGGSDYSAIGKLYGDYMSGGDIVDTSSIRSRAIADLQDRINALNQVYDSQLARVKQEGVGREGEATALLAARGLAGSMRGGAIAEQTRGYNRDLMANVDSERNNAIQGILSDANKAAIAEIENKTQARLSGANSLVSYLKGADERKQSFIASVAQNLLATGVDLQSMSPEQVSQLQDIARKAGVSVQNIVAAYQNAKASQSTGDGFSLSSGQARYDAQGNLLAQNGGGTGGVSDGAIAMATQVSNGTMTLAQVPSAMRGEVAGVLNSMPNPRVNELDQIISTIDELSANPRLKAILGPLDQMRGNLLLGGKAATAKNLYDQLTGILALEGRSKLKGSGAISDFEFKVLKEAQSALGRNLNETEFKKQLEKVRTALENRKAQLGGSQQMSSSTDGGTFAEQWQ